MRVRLGFWSGVGLVVANMIGAGVFVSAGFMAQDMGPAPILLAWLVGTTMAVAGTLAYSEVARLVPRSGGEYRYLSELWHPALGYVAGWATLLVGFSAPVAIDALAAAAFVGTLTPMADPRPLATGFIVAATAVHAIDLRISQWSQNALFAAKIVLVGGFAVLGVAAGRHEWPTWSPPHGSAAFPVEAFMASLVYIAFAFSGWNAAVYAAEEFEKPDRDIPRSMLAGCLMVSVVYMMVNWVFVANLTPDRAAVVFGYEASRVTLGHLVAGDILGERGAGLMSVLATVALVSAISAMTFAGPRVYAAMARDGFLPPFLVARAGKPPGASVVLQGVLASALLWTHELRQILQNLGSILVLFAALTALSLYRARGRPGVRAPRMLPLVAAAFYGASALVILYFAFRASVGLLLWVGVVAAAALVAFAVQRGLTARRARS